MDHLKDTHWTDEEAIDKSWADLQSAMHTYSASKELGTRKRAVIAAKHMLRSLQDGDGAFFDNLESMSALNTLNFLSRLSVPSKIPATGSISAAALAQSVSADESFIVRLMRPVCCYGIFAETGERAYAHTQRSRILLQPGYKSFQDFSFDVLFPPVAALPEYFRDGDRPLQSPSSATHNPLSWVHGMDGADFIAVCARDEERLQRFTQAFAGRWAHVPAMGIYPFDTELGDLAAECAVTGRVLVVDVGGSHGDSMKELRETCPALQAGRIVLQDLPPTIASIPAGFLPAAYDIQAQAHSFFEPQPVRGAGAYYLRRVLHDWPPAEAVTILKHIVDAMADDSRVLVADTVVPDRVQLEDNYVYTLDVWMMMFGGCERTLADWSALFENAGLELVRVWRKEGTAQAVVEGRKRRA